MVCKIIKIIVTGDQLLMFVQDSAVTPYVDKVPQSDGEDCYVLGQTSEYGYKHLRILADGNPRIFTSKTYHSITVESCVWDTKTNGAVSDDSFRKNEVDGFTQRIMDAFSPKPREIPEWCEGDQAIGIFRSSDSKLSSCLFENEEDAQTAKANNVCKMILIPKRSLEAYKEIRRLVEMINVLEEDSAELFDVWLKK